MHDYLFTAEVVRFAFVFGVAVSMLLYERRHLTTGSIVVPGYVATFAVYPLIIAATAVNAGLSYLIVNKVLNRWFLLYGRTKFTVLALVSISIQTAMLKLSPSGAWLWESDIKLVVGVGYVVPALIAHDMGRQGVRKTIKSVSLASAIVLVPIVFALWIDMPGINDLAPLTGTGRMAVDAPWIPVAVLLSAAAAWGVSHNYGLRSGGFMGASFIAILLGDPWQVGVAIALALATYLFVTRMLMNEMILFGRRKFSAMLLVSATASWIMLWIGSDLIGVDALQHVDVGALALTPLIVPGLVANDAQRTGPGQVLAGLGLATVFVLCTTWWVQSLVQQSHLQFGWKALSLLSFSCIFWPQLSPNRFARRAEQAGAVPIPAVALETESTPAFGFSIAGYRGWAQLHTDAADAAEAWLSSIVGDTLRPAVAAPAFAAAPAPERPERAVDARAERICRWRAAAKRALDDDAGSRPTGGWSGARVSGRPLPTRRAAAPTSVEATDGVDMTSADRMPTPLPRRQATDTSLAPTGPMIGAASLLPQRTVLPTTGGDDAPTVARPAARVVPSSAPAGDVNPIDVSLPADEAEAVDAEAPTRQTT